MKRPRLMYHTKILPAWMSHPVRDPDDWLHKHEHLKEINPNFWQEADTSVRAIHAIYRDLPEAVLFDCRALDTDFLCDTGFVTNQENSEQGQPTRLPHTHCYFEFGDGVGVYAHERPVYKSDLGANRVIGFQVVATAFYMDDVKFVEAHTTHMNGIDEREPNTYDWQVQCDHGLDVTDFAHMSVPPSEVDVDNHYNYLIEASRMMSGTLTLLNEQLIATEVVPEGSPQLNKARARRGRPPVDSVYRILTINTAAVRRRVDQDRTPGAEPRKGVRLHWRRGHWRTLHRGSEFEGRAWVRRCLVGDPDLGAVNKDYRLTWQLPLLEPTQQEK